MTTPLKIEDAAARRRYELTQAGELAARVEYRLSDGRIELVHTEVQPSHEGQGLGSKIAKFALEDARARGLAVVPSCSYIATYIERHPEYGDLVTR